jgi:hypothetical protein
MHERAGRAFRCPNHEFASRAGLAASFSPLFGAATRKLAAVAPCVCSPGPAGCGTHAPLLFSHAPSTRIRSATGDGRAVRQSSPETPSPAALLGRLSRGSKAAPNPARKRHTRARGEPAERRLRRETLWFPSVRSPRRGGRRMAAAKRVSRSNDALCGTRRRDGSPLAQRSVIGFRVGGSDECGTDL